jgi:membrane protein required for colicin V production
MDNFTTDSFNYLDMLVITIVALSTLIGFFRGFIASSMSMAGWVLSVCLSYVLFPQIAPFLEAKLHHPVAVVVVGYMALLMGLLLLFGMLNIAFCNATATLRQGAIDRFLGAGLGAFRGFFIIAVFFLAFVMAINLLHGHDDLSDDANIKYNWIVNANTYNVLISSKNALSSALPSSLSQGMQQFYDDYLNNKTTDERFVAYAIDKLNSKLPKNLVEEIDKDVADKSLIMSEHDLEVYNLQKLVKAYKSNKNANTNMALSKAELTRVDKILKQEAKHSFEKPFVEEES